MKRFLVFIVVLFAHFAITMVQCFGQVDKQLAKTVESMYNKRRFEHVIFNYEGRWYFATAVVNRSFDRIGDINQASREKTISFFIRNGKKKYPYYTRFPQDMAESENIEDIYVLLKGKKSSFYEMPQIAKFKTDLSSEVYIFAKPIADAPNKSVTQNNNADLGKTSYNTNTEASSTITQNSNKSPDNNTSNANQSSQSITLVVYGTANSKDEAIKTALRSAIEQAFGTFVSANTTIVNDELTKDEIVSVTSGNIENYSLISSDMQPDGKCSVSIKATVSIGKLIQFAQSKGTSTELAGATFAMNMKMRKLNKENEYQAICHMLDKVIKMSEQNLFDYEIKTEEPKIVEGIQDLYGIPTIILVTPNDNYFNIFNEIRSTIKSLSLSEKEQKEYNNSNDNFFKFHGLNFGSGYWFLNETNCLTLFDFVLRNNIEESSKIQKKLRKLKTNIYKSSMSFEISDNLGNSSSPIIVTYKGKCSNDNVDICIGCDWPIYCHRYSDALDIYGITANEGSYNINFMGGSKGFIDGDVCVFISKFLVKQYERSDKSKYKLSYGWSNPHPYQRHSEDKYIGCVPFYNYIFSKSSNGYLLPCLDYFKTPYPFKIYLYYNENDISRLSSLNVSPVNPSDFLKKTVE